MKLSSWREIFTADWIRKQKARWCFVIAMIKMRIKKRILKYGLIGLIIGVGFSLFAVFILPYVMLFFGIVAMLELQPLSSVSSFLISVLGFLMSPAYTLLGLETSFETNSQYYLQFLTVFLFYMVIGFIIGYVVGKIKSKK